MHCHSNCSKYFFLSNLRPVLRATLGVILRATPELFQKQFEWLCTDAGIGSKSFLEQLWNYLKDILTAALSNTYITHMAVLKLF